MTDNGAAPPLLLTATGAARISVIERTGGGVHGQPGLWLAAARGAAGARLRRRFDQLSMSARPAPGLAGRGAVCWRVGTGDSAAEVSGCWQAAGDGRFLLASGSPGAGPGAGETLDGVLRKRPGRPGEWELDLLYTHAAAARITLARVTTACAAAASSDGARGQAAAPAGWGITVPAAYDITIRPAIDGTGWGQLPGTLAFLELLDRHAPRWPPFLLTGHDGLRPGFLTWGVTEAGDAEVTVDGRALHVRLGPEHANGALPSWYITDPAGLPVCLPYQAVTGTADFAVDGESVTGTVRLAGPPGGHSYQAEISGTRHRERGAGPTAGLGAAGQEPERAWLDRLCAEFDLTLNCVQGITGQPAVPALLMAFPADLRSSLFELSLVAAGSPGQPGYISWSLSGLSTTRHVSADRLTVSGPPGPQWYADEGTLIAVADAKLELTHDTVAHSVAGELTVTGTTGRLFRAVITGSWRGSAAAAVRRSLAAPDFTGPWRGVLGTDAVLAVSAAADGWWRPAAQHPAADHPAHGQPGPLFLRHATGPDLAVGFTGDGSLVAFERAQPAVTGEAAVTDGAALRAVGQRLMHQQRYAEALRLLGRAAACFARQADAAERTGHDIAARNYLVSASASAAERAFCALAVSDYPALLRCLAEDVGWRRRLIGLAPALSGAVLAGARQLPGSLENWRLRLDEDADRIDGVAAGTSFYELLALFMLDHGAVEDALVAAELGRARSFADLLASPDRSRGTFAAPRFSRKVLRETVAGQHTAVEYLLTDHGLLIFVIDAAGETRSVPAAADATPRLTASAERYRQIMTAGRADGTGLDETALDEVLRELYEVLWQPVAALLPAAPDQAVLIVPHGAAMQVPFPGLRAANGQYLIQRHAIALLPGLALLPMLGERAAARAEAVDGPAELLAFISPEPLPANPDTGAPLPPLTGIAERSAAIARGYPRATVCAGRDASAAALLGGAAEQGRRAGPRAQPAVLHFGTHAFVSQRQTADPLDSFIALARTGGAGAGADGRLRARDLLGARIPGDVAVLAACTTGRGKVTGDGVVGLSRAFLAAGPTTLVLTLSEVDEDSSLELMSGFHERLRSGHRSRAQALAGAQRQLISDGEPAQGWSSFVLFGLPLPWPLRRPRSRRARRSPRWSGCGSRC